jgi:SPP1 family predicted phage head-tail adaptor
MNPGKLKHRIKIQDKQIIKDPVTKLTKEQLVTIYECWASIDQPRGRRFFEAAVAHLEYSVFFQIRYKEDIKPGMYVNYSGRNFLIEKVSHDLQDKKWTTLQCTEVI